MGEETASDSNGEGSLALFVGDSYFAYLLARPLIELEHGRIGLVVNSVRTTRTLPAMASMLRRSSAQYVAYRSLVQLLPTIHPRFRGRTVRGLCDLHGITAFAHADVNALAQDPRLDVDLGIAINMDQILSSQLLQAPRRGVIGIHASRLPADKGISPALWAFARGDRVVWVSIYRLVSGVDDGPILDQFSVPVRVDDTAFSLYERVCSAAGERLLDVLSALRSGSQPRAQQGAGGDPLGWPDATHRKMMKAHDRKLISRHDLFRPRN
ncbi:MAG: formyltransferase family protein [Acidimicrobiales bacterium]